VKRVQLESPYAGDIAMHVRYAQDALRDSINKGEAPFASHLLYPQVLDESKKEDRLKGIVCGYQWMMTADLVAFYIDLGMSDGMKSALERAKSAGKPFEMRRIYADPNDD
jgi:hypothetical protein